MADAGDQPPRDLGANQFGGKAELYLSHPAGPVLSSFGEFSPPGADRSKTPATTKPCWAVGLGGCHPTPVEDVHVNQVHRHEWMAHGS